VFAAESFPQLDQDYHKAIVPLLKRYCLNCHSTEEQKGELDLERFSNVRVVRTAPRVWIKVVEMMEDGEMPPKKKPQLSPEERKIFLGWVRNYLDAEALANAGDPDNSSPNPKIFFALPEITAVSSSAAFRHPPSSPRPLSKLSARFSQL
jgi:hypothetical protein